MTDTQTKETPETVEPETTPDYSTPTEESAATPQPAEDVVYVTFPDGSLRAIPRSVVLESQAKNAAAYAGGGAFSVAPPVEDRDVSIQLSDGSFHTVKESELPGYAGTNAPLGFWEVDGKTHFIIAVHDTGWDSQKG